jgi:hypothetical protein
LIPEQDQGSIENVNDDDDSTVVPPEVMETSDGSDLDEDEEDRTSIKY